MRAEAQGMKRGKPLKRTPLNKRSKKRQKLYDEERKPLVARLLKERPWCEACQIFAGYDGKAVFVKRPSRDIHELVRRSQGGSITDEANCIAVCRPCHRRIGEYPQLAYELGLAKRSWER